MKFGPWIWQKFSCWSERSVCCGTGLVVLGRHLTGEKRERRGRDVAGAIQRATGFVYIPSLGGGNYPKYIGFPIVVPFKLPQNDINCNWIHLAW